MINWTILVGITKFRWRGCVQNDLYKIIGAVLVTIIAVLGIFALVQVISTSPLWTETGAAWIQAAGSMAALGVALFIMTRQNEQARRIALEMDERALERRVSAVCGLVMTAVDRTNFCCSNIKAQLKTTERNQLKNAIDFAQHNAEELLVSLHNVPMYELGSFELAQGVGSVIKALRLCQEMYRCAESELSNPTRPSRHIEVMDMMLSLMQEAREQFVSGLLKASTENSQTRKWWYHR